MTLYACCHCKERTITQFRKRWATAGNAAKCSACQRLNFVPQSTVNGIDVVTVVLLFFGAIFPAFVIPSFLMPIIGFSITCVVNWYLWNWVSLYPIGSLEVETAKKADYVFSGILILLTIFS
jgi:hypothetical protein